MSSLVIIYFQIKMKDFVHQKKPTMSSLQQIVGNYLWFNNGKIIQI